MIVKLKQEGTIMVTVNYSTLRNNLKTYCDKAAMTEKLSALHVKRKKCRYFKHGTIQSTQKAGSL